MPPKTPRPEASSPSAGFGKGFLYDLWYFVAPASALKPGAMERREILGQPILVGRERSGRLFALRDICPHRAAPLSAGRLVSGPDGAEAVECCYHGWLFRAQGGACSLVPSLTGGQELDVGRIGVRAYPVRESQGMVFVYVAEDPRFEGEPELLPPSFPGVVGGAPKIVVQQDFDSHIDHAVVGLMDPAHGPYVHQQWWWRSAKSQHEKAKAFEPRERGFAMVRHAPSRNSRAYKLLGGAPATEITFALPGMRWEHIEVGPRQVLALTCLTPISENRTRITELIWSDHWALTLLRPLVRAAAERFLAQDGAMVNLQNQGLKYDPPLIWIDDADRQAKWYQALKRAWIEARSKGEPFVNPVKPDILRWRS